MPCSLQPALSWEIKPSLLLRRTLLALHILALPACQVSAVSPLVKVVITIVIIYFAQKIYRRKTRFDRTNWLHLQADKSWAIANNKLDRKPIIILPSTIINAYLLVIHYQTTTYFQQNLVIIYDSLPLDDYRQLMVKLRVSDIKSTNPYKNKP